MVTTTLFVVIKKKNRESRSPSKREWLNKSHPPPKESQTLREVLSTCFYTARINNAKESITELQQLSKVISFTRLMA